MRAIKAITLPNEILDLIMRASWPGVRLGLTCRRLSAQITDELADRWVTRSTMIYSETVTLTLSRLPNKTFHGISLIIDSEDEAVTETVEYDRGRITQSVVWRDRIPCRKDILVRGYVCYWQDYDIHICDKSGPAVKILRNHPIDLLKFASLDWITRSGRCDGDVGTIYVSTADDIFPMTA